MSCAIDGCHNHTHKRNWCRKHYARWERNGDPHSFGKTPTTPLRKLDATPLVEAVDRCITSRQGDMTAADRRAFYRARKRGWVGERIADRLAVRYCGLLLEELYGWDYEGVA